MSNRLKEDAHVTEAPGIVAKTGRPRTTSDDALVSMHERVPADMEAVTVERIQHAIINEFKTARATVVQRDNNTGHLISFSLSSDKASTTRENLSRFRNLRPLLVKDLSHEKRHWGRYLCGTVAIDGAFFNGKSTVLLLQGISGLLVSVNIYNIIRPSTAKVSRLFPKGRHLALIDPFCEKVADRDEIVRLNDPDDIVVWNPPITCKEWKELGNEFFRGSSPEGAFLCYGNALDKAPIAFLNAKADLAKLLTNISICKHRTGAFSLAVRYAAVASWVDPSNDTAWLLLAARLFDMGKSSVVPEACAAASAIAKSKLSSPLTTQEVKDEFSKLVVAIRAKQCPEISLDSEGNSRKTWTDAFSSESSWCIVPGIVEWCNLDGRSELQKRSNTNIRDAMSTGSTYLSQGNVVEAESIYYQAIFDSKELTSVISEIAAVMSNRAAALTTKESPRPSDLQHAMIDGCVSALLDRYNWKSWSRQVHVIEKAMGKEYALQHATKLLSTDLTSHEKRHFEPLSKYLSTQIARLHDELAACDSATAVAKTAAKKLAWGYDEDSRALRICSDSKENKFRMHKAIDKCIQELQNVRSQFTKLIDRNAVSGDGILFRRMLGPLRTRKCPDIHTEFPATVGWPEGVDVTLAKKMLKRAYLKVESQPWSMAWMMRENAFRFSHEDLQVRWGGKLGLVEIEKKKRDRLRPGDVIDWRPNRKASGFTHDTRTRSNFAINPTGTQTLTFGGTHVCIGFNDIGSLLSAKFIESQDVDQRGKPLRFIGYEGSEYCIAKFSVIACMMKDCTIPLGHVIQVWYSSTWSHGARQSFQRSLSSLLDTMHGPESEEEHRVYSYLRDWVAAEAISASSARQKWLEEQLAYHDRLTGSLSFHRSQDRIALCQYLLTGDIRLSERASRILEEPFAMSDDMPTSESNESKESSSGTTSRSRGRSTSASIMKHGQGETDHQKNARNESGANFAISRAQRRRRKKTAIKNRPENETSTKDDDSIGSLTMWNVPIGDPHLGGDSVFNTVLLEDLLEEETHADPAANIVDLFVQRTMRKLAALRHHLLENRVTIELRHGVVKPLSVEGSFDMIREIAALRPNSMSWGNVLDFMELEDFHDVARCCSSGGETVHTGYSANWTLEVYGACITDYGHDEYGSKGALNDILEASMGGTEVVEMATQGGMDALLSIPFFEAPTNISGEHLARKHYRKWTRYFARKAAQSLEKLGPKLWDRDCRMTLLTGDNCGWHFDNGGMLLPSPLYQCGRTVFMSWCYDANLEELPRFPLDNCCEWRGS